MADGMGLMPQTGTLGYDPFAQGTIAAALPTINAQREVWTAMMATPDAAAAYNDTTTLILTGPVDQGLAAEALQRLVDRHPALRACISGDGTELLIPASAEIRPDIVDLSALQLEQQADRIAEIEADHVNRAPDLGRAPSLRATIVRQAPDRLQIVLTVTHMLCDGLSWVTLLEDLAALYRGLSGGTPVEPVAHTLIDYAEVALRQETPEALAPHINYWREVFHDGGPEWSLPLDKPAPAERGWSCGRIDHLIGADVMENLRQQAKALGITGHGIVMAAFAVFIQRLSASEDVVLGIPMAGQADQGMNGMIGHAVHMAPLRAVAPVDQAFSDFAKGLRHTLLEAQEHAAADFGILLQHLPLRRERSRVPLCPIMFNIDVGMDVFDFGPVNAVLRSVPRRFDAFEMFLDSLDREEGLELTWYFADWLFEAETVKRHAATFETLLRSIAETPHARIADLALLDEAETEEILALGGSKATETVDGRTTIDLIIAQAERTPSAEALIGSLRSLTYGSLPSEIGDLAARLHNGGVKAGDTVLVHLSRDVATVTAPLAIWWIGGVYVPIDPEFPDARKRLIAEDAAPSLLLHDAELGDAPEGLCTDVLLLETGTDPSLPAPPRPTGMSPSSPAYQMYTSGSTGRPKGITISQAALVNFLEGCRERLDLGSEARILCTTTVSFDTSILEMFMPLIAGGSTVIAAADQVRDPTALIEMARRHEITHWQATPQSWRMLLTVDWEGDPNLICLSMGEPLPPDVAAGLLPRCAVLWNLYGPTEATVYATVAQVTSPERILVGSALPGYQVMVLDGRDRVLPPGFVGEIVIAGVGVADGYVNRPDETAAVFRPNPLNPSLPSYRTGDLGIMAADGQFRHLGRRDGQVKLRGYRIELEEIDGALNADPSLREGASVLLHPGTSDAELIAVVVPHDTTPEEPVLRRRLSERLPTYMIPSRFVTVSELPRTGSGKLDRKAVAARSTPESEIRSPASVGSTAPSPKPEIATPRPATAPTMVVSNEILEDVLNHWREVLRRPDAQPEDGFFDHGGHSLQAAQLMVALNRRFTIKLTLGDLLRNDTPRGLAKTVASRTGPKKPSHLVTLASGPGAVTPLVLMPPQGGQLLRYRALAAALDGHVPVYGFEQSTDLLHLETVDRIAGFFADEIADRWPQRSVAVAGYSFGGILAFRAAQILAQKGKAPAPLILLDTLNWPRESLGFKLYRSWLEARFSRPFLPWIAGKLRRNALKLIGRYTPPDWRDAALVDDPAYRVLMDAHEEALLSFTATDYAGPAVSIRATGDEIMNHLLPGGAIDDKLKGRTTTLGVDAGGHNEVIEPPFAEAVAGHIRRALGVS